MGLFSSGLVRKAVSSKVSWNKEFIVRARPYVIEGVTGEVKVQSGRIRDRLLTSRGITE